MQLGDASTVVLLLTVDLDGAFVVTLVAFAVAIGTSTVARLRTASIDGAMLVLASILGWTLLAVTNNALVLGVIVAGTVGYGVVLSTVTDDGSTDTAVESESDNADSAGETARSETADRSEPPTRHLPESLLTETPAHSFDDVGGMDELTDTLTDRIVDPLEEPDRYEEYGLGAVGGVLLYGPPGCGKTYVAEALAGETEYNFIEITPTEITSKYIGEAADNVADVFALARENEPCLLFIDEIDAIASDRSGKMTNSEQQMVNQLLTELDSIDETDVVVLAATNYVSDIDGAILRSGRFDERIEVPPPDAAARRAIFDVHLSGRPLAADLDLDAVTEATAGYAASDIELVCDLAARYAVRDDEPIHPPHLDRAIADTDTSLHGWIDRYDWLAVEDGTIVDRSATDGDSELGDRDETETAQGEEVHDAFDDIAGRSAVTDELRERVVEPVQNADQYDAHGIEPVTGALLYGPPGCDRTTLAHAVAAELDASLVELTPERLFDTGDTDAQSALESTLDAVRTADDAVLCLDRLDRIAPADGTRHQERTQLAGRLADAVDSLVDDGIVVIGTAETPHAIETPVRSRSCFAEQIEVPPPDGPSRRAIIAAELPASFLDGSIDWDRVVEATDGFTSDDLRSIATVSARRALRDSDSISTERLLETIDDTRSSLQPTPDQRP